MKLETYLDAMELAASEATMQNAMLGAISPTTKRQYLAFRARILQIFEEKEQMIHDMAWLTYCDQVTDTGMTEHIIGHGKEYANMKDWMESYINGLKPRPAEDNDD